MAKKLSADQQAMLSASDAGMHLTTVELAGKLVKDDPDNIRALIELGHAFSQLARYSEAEEAFHKAINLCEPAKRDVIFGELGNLDRARGQFAAAAQWYQKQIETDSSDATGYLFLGALMLRRGDLSEAKRILLEGLNCTVGCLEEVHYTVGLVLRSQNEFDQAACHFQKAVEIDAGYAAAKSALKDLKTARSAAVRRGQA